MNAKQFSVGARVEVVADSVSEYDIKKGSVGTIIKIDPHELLLSQTEKEIYPIQVRFEFEFLADGNPTDIGYFHPDEIVVLENESDEDFGSLDFGTILANL